MAIVGLTAAVAGCSAVPVAHPVDLPIPAQWANRAEADSRGTPDIRQWWKEFDDPALDRLIADALTANRDLVVARARVREALAGTTVAGSLLAPRLDISNAASRSKDLTRPQPIVDNQTVLLTASWEIDLLGGNRLDVQAAEAQARGADDAHRGVRVSLAAEIARNYFELRGLQARTDVLRRNIDVQRETLRLVDGRFRAGLATDLDVARATAQLRSTRAALPDLGSEAAARRHRLGVLTGRPPTDLDGTFRSRGALPDAVPALPALLPADLLVQRPDLRRAREAVIAHAAELGSARTDLFPKFFLSAAVGRQSTRIDPLPRRSADVFSLGALLTTPIFNAGRIRAGIEAADARLAQVAAGYEQAFLEALEDVENAYVIHAAAKARRDELAAAFTAAARARSRAEALYSQGATDYLAVLDTQRIALANEEALVRAETGVVLSVVGLYRAFGGGWEHE